MSPQSARLVRVLAAYIMRSGNNIDGKANIILTGDTDTGGTRHRREVPTSLHDRKFSLKAVPGYKMPLFFAIACTAAAIGWSARELPWMAGMPANLAFYISSCLLAACAASWLLFLKSMICDRNDTGQSNEAWELSFDLAQERDLLRMVIDNLPDLIYAKDHEGRFVLNNLAHAKSLGANSPREMIGKTDFDYYPQDLAEQFFQDEQQIIKTGTSILNQEQYKSTPDNPSGQKNWSSTTKAIWRNRNNEAVGTVGITRDIHLIKIAQDRLRENEERLRTILTQTRCIVSAGEATGPEGWQPKALDPATPFLWDLSVINPEAAQEVLPLELSAGQPYHQAWLASCKPEDTLLMHQNSGRAFLENAPLYQNLFRCTDKHGVEHWMHQYVTIKKLEANRWQLFSITTDITEVKRAESALRDSEEKLRQSATQLERSNRELQDFAYVASHDLQEPLRKIVVFGDRLKEKYATALDEGAGDYLERMQKAATRMQKLINDLLAFSRVTTKSRPFAPVNLREVASEVLEDLEGRLESVKGRVELGGLPTIDAEPLQIRQLLQNLIGNALKFHRPEESPVVKVTAELVHDHATTSTDGFNGSQQFCRLIVADNGIGFEEKYLDKIFNVFQRLHTRNDYEGTGMGLAIAKKIAHHHNGDITARSQPGCGATFIVTLPVSHPKTETNHNA